MRRLIVVMGCVAVAEWGQDGMIQPRASGRAQ